MKKRSVPIKILSVICAMFIFMTAVPGVSVSAASSQLVASVTVSGTTRMDTPDDTAEVQLYMKSSAYNGIKEEPNDVILVIDRSGSMSNDYSNMLDAARNFISRLDLTVHRIGIVAYETGVSSCDLTSDLAVLSAYIDELETKGVDGSTAMDRGIDTAVSLLSSKRSGVQGTIVLMTDGEPDDQASAENSSANAKALGYVFYSVALTKTKDSPANTMLKSMATSEASHYFVMDSTQLMPVYNRIAQKIGKIYPKDVVVRLNIGAGLELVPGSADNNTPPPDEITADALIWHMNSLTEGETRFNFSVRPNKYAAQESIKAGSGDITYTDYNGVTQTITLGGGSVWVCRPMITVTGISPDTGTEGYDTPVVISGENFTSDCKVSVNVFTITPTSVAADGKSLSAVIPSMSEGTYKVVVKNANDSYGKVDFAVGAPVRKLSITGITPDSAVEKTSPVVTVTGAGFTETKTGIGAKDPTVRFGSMIITPTKVSDTEIELKLPDKKAGIYTITIINDKGETESINFEYTPTPPPDPISIVKVEPPEAVANKPQTVTITGTGFKAKTAKPTVKLGAKIISASDVTVVDDNTIRVNLPQKKVGTYTIYVIDCDSRSATWKYSYKKAVPVVETVTIASVDPPQAVAGKPQTVIIKGTGFKAKTAGEPTVKLGAKVISASDVEVIDENTIRVNLPQKKAGTYTIYVINKNNVSGKKDDYKYEKAVPIVNTVSIDNLTPDKAPENTSPDITITGTGFDANTTVKLGAKIISSSDVTVVDDKTIKVTLPPKSAGTYNINVINSSGLSASKPFTYTSEPPETISITRFDPGASAPENTSPTITIIGTGFNANTTVKLGAKIISASDVEVIDDKTIKVTLPSKSAGIYNIYVINSSGLSASKEFEYIAEPVQQISITSIEESTDPADTYPTVIITGMGFKAQSGAKPTVKLGAKIINSSDVEVLGENTIKVKLPPRQARTYSIYVINCDGYSASTDFTYT